jgi:phosphinothricin acetyltransferase
MDAFTLRIAEPSDGEAIASIYRPYVETTATTFEETPPAPEAVASDIRTRLETHPWFVAEHDDDVLGYAYAAPLRKRDAYRWTVELSIYLDRERRGRGFGSALYAALLETLDRQGFESAYGVVTLPNPESVGFHESFGFERVGVLPEAGYKLGAWHDVAWYERSIGARSASPSEPISFGACRNEPWLEELLVSASDPVS